MPLPALIAGFLSRAAAAEGAASAAGSRAAASAAQSAVKAGHAQPPMLPWEKMAANAKKAEAAAQRWGQQVQTVQQRVQAAEGTVSNLGAALGNKLAHGITTALDAIAAAAGPVQNLVRLANPARANQFTIALEDAFAVIGRMLIPVLDGFTVAARKVGDFYAGLEPVIGPVMGKIGELIEKTFTKWMQVAERNAPVIEMLADALVKLGDVAIRAVDLVLTAVDKVFSRLPRWVARQLGYDASTTRADFSRTSRGAAVRQVSFVGTKAIADQAIKNALMTGANGRPTKSADKSLESIDQKMSELIKQVKQQMADDGDARGKGLTAGFVQALRQVATQPAG